MNQFAKVVGLVLLCFCCSVSCQDKTKNTIVKIDKVTLQEAVKGNNVQLVDVRTPEEYAAGYIGEAVNYNIIDSETFLRQIEGLDKEEPVYLYCKMGGRSNRAAILLKEKGFTAIYDYSGGYNDWVSE